MIERIADEQTIIVAPKSCTNRINHQVTVVKSGDFVEIGEIRIKAIDAYNTNEGHSTRKVHHKGDFVGYSVLFQGRKIYFAGDTDLIPDELSAVFSQLDSRELKRIVKRNTQWICLAHGMLHYYGVMGIRTLMEKIESLMNQKIDMLEFIHVMSFACDVYGQLRFTSAGYHDRKVSNVEHIIQEQKMRSGLDDYPFSKIQRVIRIISTKHRK